MSPPLPPPWKKPKEKATTIHNEAWKNKKFGLELLDSEESYLMHANIHS